jgi:hypothetical protein
VEELQILAANLQDSIVYRGSNHWWTCKNTKWELEVGLALELASAERTSAEVPVEHKPEAAQPSQAVVPIEWLYR